MNFLISLSLLLVMTVGVSVESKKTSSRSKNVPRISSRSQNPQFVDDYSFNDGSNNDMYGDMERAAEEEVERMIDGTATSGDNYYDDVPNSSVDPDQTQRSSNDPVDQYDNNNNNNIQQDDKHVTNIIVVQDDDQDDTHFKEVIVVDGEEIPLDVDTGGNGINIIEVESDDNSQGNGDGPTDEDIVIIVSADEDSASTTTDPQMTTVATTEVADLETTTMVTENLDPDTVTQANENYDTGVAETNENYDTVTEITGDPTTEATADYDDTTMMMETTTNQNLDENYDNQDWTTPWSPDSRSTTPEIPISTTTTATIIPVTSSTTTTITNSSNCHCTIIVNNYFYNNYDPSSIDSDVMGPYIPTTNYIPPYMPTDTRFIPPTISNPNRNWKNNNNIHLRRGREGRTRTVRQFKRIGSQQRLKADGNGVQRRLKSRKFATRNLGKASGAGNLSVYRVQRRKGKKPVVRKMRKQVYRRLSPRIKQQKRSNTLTWRAVPKWKAKKLRKSNPGLKVGQIEARKVRGSSNSIAARKTAARKRANRRGRMDNNNSSSKNNVKSKSSKRSSRRRRTHPNGLKFNNKVMKMQKKVGNQFGLQELQLGLNHKLSKKRGGGGGQGQKQKQKGRRQVARKG